VRIPNARSYSARLFTRSLAVVLVAAALSACKKDATSLPVLTSITVTPSVSIAIGATQQYVAVGKDADDNEMTITPTWSIVAGGGTINATTGLFTAGTVSGPFVATVKATVGTVSGTASVTINAGALATIAVTPSPVSMAIGATQQFVAVGKDASNNVVTIVPVWTVVASGGTISATTGLFTAGTTAGVFASTVKATSGTISGTSSVTVTVGSLATIAVTPSSAVLVAGSTQQYTAVGKDAGNNTVVITPVWSVVASGGTISAAGLFTAGSVAGSYANTVKATSGTISGTASVNVSAAGAGPAAVNLGSSINYVILAKSAISNVPTSAITGDLGLSPAAASFITGFSLTLPAASPFSTSAQVTGQVFASDYNTPTPSNLTTAVSDMETAYTDAAGRVTPDYLELATGAIGGLTLPRGLYKWTNTVTIGSDITLNGSATDIWIFQIAGGITQASATRVHLTGGALAKNVFWQVFGVVDIGTTAHMEGIILSQTSITLATGATANGRLLAQTAVSLAGNTVVKPAP
jgi:hypothetical protein